MSPAEIQLLRMVERLVSAGLPVRKSLRLVATTYCVDLLLLTAQYYEVHHVG